MTKEHYFGSTGEAYDACQCDTDIKDGDTLIIESERVVGVAHTWPVAVTAAHGELHRLESGATPEEWAEEEPELLAGWHAAIEVAKRLGY